MNPIWLMAVLTLIGLALIAVDFYLPGFVLGSIGIVLMLVAVLSIAPLGAHGVLGNSRLQRGNSLRRNRPSVRGATVNGVATHAIDVVEQHLAVSRGDIQHGSVCRQLVGDGLREMPLLRLNRHWQVALR